MLKQTWWRLCGYLQFERDYVRSLIRIRLLQESKREKEVKADSATCKIQMCQLPRRPMHRIILSSERKRRRVL